MSALSASRRQRTERWTHKVFPLAAVQAFKGGAACIDTATGYVTNAAVSTTLQPIGTFDEDKDNSGGGAGDLSVNVALSRELALTRFVNGAGADEIVAADIGQPCYFLDDQTVSIVATAHSLAGIIWDVSETKGVAVELVPGIAAGVAATPTITDFTNAQHGHTGATSGGALAAPAITSFAAAAHDHDDAAGGGGIRMASAGAIVFDGADDCAIATPGKWKHYIIPATTGASTVTLGNASSVRGDQIVFTADGTVNDQTVTYYDGATAISAAATASKRHVATCTFDGTNWVCALSVGP